MDGGMTFKWTNEYEKTFCELCIKFIMKNGRVPFKWKEINKEFETIINRKCSDKTLKNKFESMKKDWRTWRFLKFGETGLGWDPVTGKLDCSEEWWSRKVKENRDAKKFRNKSVDSTLEDLWNQIFEDNYATGANVVAPSMVPDSVNIDVEEGDKESGEEDNDESDGDHIYSEYNQYASRVDHLLSEERLFWPNLMREFGNTQIPSQGINGSQVPNQGLGGSQVPGQGLGGGQVPSQGGAKLSTQIDALVSSSKTALDIMRSDDSVSKNANAKSSIVATIEVINRMVTGCDLKKGSELWCFAYGVIENEVRREIFLNMEDDVSRKAWLIYMHAKEN
ncbi:Myb/SANT-like domain [Sesbania bispinosa]|nr:Myb/SANT-like domain [Sesbania bispinosa]